MSLDPLRRYAASLAALTLPSRRVCALLVLACLGFGVLVGRAQRPAAAGGLAAARSVLMLPAAPTATSPSTAVTPQAPASEATPTPEAQTRPASPAHRSQGGAAKAGGFSQDAGASAGAGGPGGGSGSRAGGDSTAPAAKLPPIKHVFLVVLAEEPYASVFGPASPAPYLAQTLAHRGTLLVRDYAVAHEELANAIALVSGQGPTAQTAVDCPTYTDIAPGGVGARAQVEGQGCVYPRATRTIFGQLTARHLRGRAYIGGLAQAGSTQACAHPTLGSVDPGAGLSPAAAAGVSGAAAVATPAGREYATFRNPFAYFHSVIDGAGCAEEVVDLSRLHADLAGGSRRTPSFSYIAPGLCEDGRTTPCAPGRPGGVRAAEGFLKRVVPQILSSQAYRRDGLLAITVDEAPAIGEFADSSSCCGQPSFPNIPSGGGAAPLGPAGGGQVGALLLSPFVKKPGGLDQDPYNHFSLLRTFEDLFALRHLGYAALPEVKPLAPTVFSGSSGE